jgi:hypothetical protein
MAMRAAKRRAKRLGALMTKRVGGASPFVAFDLLRLNRANLRTNPHGRMKPTGGFRRQRAAGRAMLESSTNPQPFARCNRMSPCGHRSFVRVRSDVRRGFLCDPRLIVRRFLLEA